jgi:hypothetical protein
VGTKIGSWMLAIMIEEAEENIADIKQRIIHQFGHE